MTYAVTIELAPPAGTNPLDRLVTEAVAVLLDEFLSQALEAVGLDSAVITVTDRWVGLHPDGAIVVLIVNAPYAEAAMNAVSALVAYGLDSIEALAGWAITKTEVGHRRTDPIETPPRRRRTGMKSRRLPGHR